jgi:hypothetical protein
MKKKITESNNYYESQIKLAINRILSEGNEGKAASRKHSMGEYYAKYDNDSKMWCVFHTDLKPKEGHAFSSHASKESAKEAAKERNGYKNEGLGIATHCLLCGKRTIGGEKYHKECLRKENPVKK